ncbi:MAG: HlyD family efflux transporter periplasmic adaptor subunit, partial [Rhodospirillales bacterium]|nr:HlyD family efflux transporter periplasmic adaptor subunit [Rhodospirillales bacterium]
VHVARGQRVAAGTPLLSFASPDIEHRREVIRARLAGKAAELEAGKLEREFRERISVLIEGIARLRAELAALDAEAERLTVTAPHDGIFLDPLPDLRPGTWLSSRQQLGLVRGEAAAIAMAYVSEDDIERIAEGDGAAFIPRNPDAPRAEGRIVAIDRSPVKGLSEPAVATINGGDIPVRLSGQILVPQAGYYRIRVRMEGAPPGVKLVGHVVVNGQGRSLLERLRRSVLVVLLREWGA